MCHESLHDELHMHNRVVVKRELGLKGAVGKVEKGVDFASKAPLPLQLLDFTERYPLTFSS